MSTLHGSQVLRSTTIILIGFSLLMKQFWSHLSYLLRPKVVCHADLKVFQIFIIQLFFSYVYFLGVTR